MRLPDFIIMGAAKSGTTTLYQYLCKHPQVLMSTPKEPDFFSVDENFSKGIDWYASLFSAAKPDQICGEASTTYSRWQQHPNTVSRLVQALPQVKLIYIMRHPVDRAYSFYIHRFKGARYKPQLAVAETFEKTITQQSEFLDSSLYMEQIEQYLPFYPREAFLFLFMEDLMKQPAETLKMICQFLEIDDEVDLINNTLIEANKAGDNPEWYVKKQLTDPIKSIPGAELLRSLLPKELRDQGYKILKNLMYERWAKKQYMPPAMLPETRETLLQHFSKPNAQLSAFLNRDLSHWSK